MERLDLYFLGEPRIERNGKPLQFDTRKAIALLAYLAITGESHSRDALAALLYPESDQVKSRGALRRTLSALKQALGDDWLDIERETIGLPARPGLSVDVAEFHRLETLTSKHGHARNDVCSACIEPLGKAVALYRDEFLAGFTLRDSPNYDDWQFFQTETLRRELVTLLAKLVCRCSEDRMFQEAIGYARRWLALEPLEEAGHRQLMYLYAWTGQRTAALRQYRECVRLLEQELGVAPLPETTELYRAIEENREAKPRGSSEQPSGAPSAVKGQKKANGAKKQAESGRKAKAKTQAQNVVSVAIATVLPALPPRPVSSAAYPFVGRARELNRLIGVYDGAGQDGRFVIVEGEAGIGKTRLAEEFILQTQRRGATVIAARCYEGQENLAYGPFVEGLRALNLPLRSRDWLERISPSALAEAARLLPELESLQPLPPLAPPEGPGAQSRFLESMSQLFLAICGGNTQGVLFIDDLQWADTASLDLLTYLVRRLHGRPLYILGTLRSEDAAPDHRLRQLLAEAQRNGTGIAWTLARLDREAVMELVQSAAEGGVAIKPELAERVYSESEGQPFFLTEYLSLIANGPPEKGEWELPGSVRAVLGSRLARISETGRQLLSTAAVIGRSFDFDTLSAASGRSDIETVTGLEELLAQGLIQEVRQGPGEGKPTLDFRHEKLRTLVYQETSLVRLRLLHRRVAEALSNQARLGHNTEHLANQIARHYQAAGQDREAAEYFKTAGDYARSLYANAEALQDYQAALALGYPNAATLHEAIGDLQMLSGEYNLALHSYETTIAFREGQTDGGIESKIADVHTRRGDWEQAEKHFQAALNALGDESPCEICSKIYGDWSLVALRNGDPDRALELARRALELAEGTRDQRGIAQAHNMLGILARHQNDTALARSHLEQSLALSETMNDPGIRSAALNNLALVCMDCGDVPAGISHTEKALGLSKAQGDRHREAALHNNLADLFHATGNAEAAMEHLRQAVTIYAEIGTDAGTWQPEIWKLAEW